MKKSILITESAHTTIETVSRHCPVETGGVLVGIFADPLVIVGAGQPGENAIHHSVSFTSDPAADIKCLSAWRQVHGLAIEVLGWFHKHYSLQVPSSGDQNQACQLQEEINDNRPILMGIVSESGLLKKKLKLRFFGLEENSKQIEYGWNIIPDDGPEIEKAIQSMPDRPDLKSTHYWDDPEFQFYTNQLGRKRICSDIQQLKNAGWYTVVLRNKTNGDITLQLKKDSIEMLLELPPEYPLNAPAVLSYDKEKVFGLNTICEWNSITTLMDVVAEVEQRRLCSFCRNRKLLPCKY